MGENGRIGDLDWPYTKKTVRFRLASNFGAWGKEGSSTRLAPARLGRLAVWRRSNHKAQRSEHLDFCPSLKLSIKLMLHLSASDISKGLFRGMWKY